MNHSKSSDRLLTFIILTCLLNWLLGGILWLADVKLNSFAYTVLGAVYMLVPAAVAVYLQKFRYKEQITSAFRLSFKLNRWFVVALLTPFVAILMALGISLLLPDVHLSSTGAGLAERFGNALPPEQLAQLSSISPLTMAVLMLVQGLIAACTINGLFALGEELGWRGYMLHYLEGISFFKVTLFTGAVWGIWHFPLILLGHNYPQHPIAGVAMMTVFCILLAPMITYISLKAKSVIAAAIFHGSLNAFAGFPLLYLAGGSDLSSGITGYAGFIALIIINLCLFVFDKFISKENIFTTPIKAMK
jgi:hypothetical protein